MICPKFMQFIPQRVILAIMGFLAIVNAYTMRICISITIIEMVVSPHNTTSGENNDAERYEWSQELQGIILSSFFWGYVVTHLPGGWLSEKFGGKYILSLGILSTAIFTLLTPMVVTWGGAKGLIILRVLMGLGEGTTFPALSALIANWIPSSERSKVGAFVFGGGHVGSIVGTIISGLLLQHIKGWACVFYFFGIMAIIWFILFTILCYSDPDSHPFISEKEKNYLKKQLGQLKRNENISGTPWKSILTSIPLICLIVAQIGHDWGFFIMVFDLPKYMNDVLNFSIQENGIVSALPFALMWIIAMLSGFLSDYLINADFIGITNARKLYTGIAAIGPGIFMVAASYAGFNKALVVLFFTIAMGFMGTFYPSLKVNAIDLSPNYAATLMALTNGIGALAGIFAPYVAGVLTPHASLEEWRIVFWISLLLFIISAAIYCTWASAEIQSWNSPAHKKTVPIENEIHVTRFEQVSFT